MMKKIFLIMILLFYVTGCSEFLRATNSNDYYVSSENANNDQKRQIYDLAVNAGYIGTYEQWLESIKGENGEDGNTVLTGGSNPSNTKGKESDLYINTVSWEVFIKVNDEWNSLGVIKGESGQDGADGLNGSDGQNGKDGETPFIGENGNWWIGEEDTGVRATGQDGTDGFNGSDGQNGKDGATWIAGEGEPSYTIGKTNDLYIDTFTYNIYQKEDVNWKFIGNIKGQDAPHYNEKVTVTFEVNGGEMPNDYQDTIIVNYGETIDLPHPTKENYIFEGWYTGYTVNDGKFLNTTPVTKNIVLYAFWIEDIANDTFYNELFYNLDILEESKLVDNRNLNGKTINKYHLATLNNIPISSGPASVLFGSEATLGISKTNITTVGIEKGLEVSNTIGTEIAKSTTESTEIGFEFEIPKIDFLSFNYTDVKEETTTTTEINTTTYTDIQNWLYSQSEEKSFETSYQISANKQKYGYYYRIDIVTNVKYYANFIYDERTGVTSCVVSSEIMTDNNGNPIFATIIEESEDGSFNIEKKEYEYDISGFTKEKLEKDGLYISYFDGVYSNYITDNNSHVVNSSNSKLAYKINFENKFGINKNEIENLSSYKTMNINLSFTVFNNKYKASNYEIKIVNDLDYSELLYSVSCPTQKEDAKYEKNKEHSINLNIENLSNEFYVLIEIPGENDEFIISNIHITMKIVPSISEISYKEVSENFTAKAVGLDDLFSESNVGVVNTTFEQLFGINKNVLKNLGYNKIEVEINYNIYKTKYALPGGMYINESISNTGIAYFTNTYSDESFLNTVNAMSTTATGTCIVNLADLKSDNIYIILNALLSPSSNTTTQQVCEYSNISITFKLLK